ncbi:MAG TPA: alpha/beta fold hydrolase [Acidimicrobiales bacterium]|nr:alpha/beta fold hydrolase [Acidimicrobiales bacterium]
MTDAAFAELPGLSLCHRVVGDGPPVLAISGTGGDLRHSPGLLDGPLPRHFTTLGYDQRGLGRSSVVDTPLTMADFADDAADLIAHVGWAACAVVGVSFGGMVAQELALRHPHLVSKLVLCCTSSGGDGGSSYPLHELFDLPADERGRRSLALSDVRLGDEWQRAHPDELREMLAAAAAERTAVGADEPGRLVGARRQLEARAGHDTWHRLPGIDAPTLVCAGRYDGIAPLANSEALAARIPGARLEVFDGGHLFMLQDRRAWDVIVDFLRR